MKPSLAPTRVQHLDDRPVGRHRAARREDHRQHGRDEHEDRASRCRRPPWCRPWCACGRSRRDDRRGSRRHLGWSASRAAPARSAAARRASRRRSGAGPADRRGRARLPSHGSSSCAIPPCRVGAARRRRRRAARAIARPCRTRPRCRARDRAHLDRDLARDVGLPVAPMRRAPASPRRCVRQARKRHDRDDGDQRAAGDRALRHDRAEPARHAIERAWPAIDGVPGSIMGAIGSVIDMSAGLRAAPGGARRTGSSG